MPNGGSGFTNKKQVVGSLLIYVWLISRDEISKENAEAIDRIVQTEGWRSVAESWNRRDFLKYRCPWTTKWTLNFSEAILRFLRHLMLLPPRRSALLRRSSFYMRRKLLRSSNPSSSSFSTTMHVGSCAHGSEGWNSCTRWMPLVPPPPSLTTLKMRR